MTKAKGKAAEHLLGVAQVCELTGYSRSGLAKMVREGRFAPPLDLGGAGHKLGWRASQVNEWIESLPVATAPVWQPKAARS